VKQQLNATFVMGLATALRAKELAMAGNAPTVRARDIALSVKEAANG